MPFETLENLPYEEGFELTCKNISKIADIGQKHGIHFQLEVQGECWHGDRLLAPVGGW